MLNLAKAGDRASREALLARYTGYLNAIARSQFDERLRRRLSATDLVQETLLEAHRDFEKFAGTTTLEFTGWLRKIFVHNLGRQVEMQFMAAKRDIRRERPIDELADSVNQSHLRLSSILKAKGRGPASEVEHQELLVNMSNAIAQLPTEYREVIALRHLDGLSFQEVARRMQRTSGATRMLWLRAIEKLREQMEVSI